MSRPYFARPFLSSLGFLSLRPPNPAGQRRRIKPPLYAGGTPRYSFRTMIVPLSKVRLRQDEDGVWIAKSDLLPGCHAHGRDRGEATLRFQQAAKAHLEALLETGRPIPPAFRDKFVLAA